MRFQQLLRRQGPLPCPPALPTVDISGVWARTQEDSLSPEGHLLAPNIYFSGELDLGKLASQRWGRVVIRIQLF